MIDIPKTQDCSLNCSVACTKFKLPFEFYQEDSLAREIEEAINRSLPELPRLLPCFSNKERLAVFESSIAASFDEFTARYGDPFGCSPVVVELGEYQLPAQSRVNILERVAVFG